jgi:hypothetical protein
MTAPAPPVPPEAATGPGRTSGQTPRPRRWHRAVIPFAVLGLLFTLTYVAHLVEEPDLGDPGTLSPTGTGPDGSSRLAEMLTADGVRIHRVTSSDAALAAARDNQAVTVFVPAPELLKPGFYAAMAQRPGAQRLVLVRPTDVARALGLLSGMPRWAAKAVPPDCDVDFAVSAGKASVLRSRYAGEDGLPEISCYGGGLVGRVAEDQEWLAVGASDPFRNARIDEVGNAALATALLNRHRDLIWVDVHKSERNSNMPKPEFELPSYRQPERQSRTEDGLWAAMPASLWAALALLMGVGVLTALAQARRLGAPVAEPLPAVVPATETVTGRGRLYARISAREASLETLRAAALRRMAAVLKPFGEPRRTTPRLDDELVAQIAARAGIPPDEVRAILHGPAPQTDDELQVAVARLDALVNAVLRVPRDPNESGRAGNAGGTP